MIYIFEGVSPIYAVKADSYEEAEDIIHRESDDYYGGIDFDCIDEMEDFYYSGFYGDPIE